MPGYPSEARLKEGAPAGGGDTHVARVLLHYAQLSTTRKVIFLTSSKTPCLSLFICKARQTIPSSEL